MTKRARRSADTRQAVGWRRAARLEGDAGRHAGQHPRPRVHRRRAEGKRRLQRCGVLQAACGACVQRWRLPLPGHLGQAREDGALRRPPPLGHALRPQRGGGIGEAL